MSPNDDPLIRQVEALIFLFRPTRSPSVSWPLPARPIRTRSSTPSRRCEAYLPGRRGIELRELAGGWVFASAPDTEEAARRLFAKPRTPPLSPAQAETLAIVAYLQPVSRPEIGLPWRQPRFGDRDPARARADRGARSLAVRRRSLPDDRAVPAAVRAGLTGRPSRDNAVGPESRGCRCAAERLAKAGDARAGLTAESSGADAEAAADAFRIERAEPVA